MERDRTLQIKAEINDLTIQINHLKDLLSDYKLMQAGDFKHSEIKEEIEELILERNQLQSQLK